MNPIEANNNIGEKGKLIKCDLETVGRIDFIRISLLSSKTVVQIVPTLYS